MGCSCAQSPHVVPNVTAHPSTASVPITVLLYDGPLLCGLNVAIKGLNSACDILTNSSVLHFIKVVVVLSYPRTRHEHRRRQHICPSVICWY